MSYKRKIYPESFATGKELTSALIGIGIQLSGRANTNQNIENTLFAASIEAINGDFRLLSLLVDWIDIHSDRILVDRLFHLVAHKNDTNINAFWASIAKWKSNDPRFNKMSKLYSGKRIDILGAGTSYHVNTKGEDSRFEGSAIRIAKNSLRQRPSDITSPEILAKKHLAYYYRVMIGSTYKADMWAALELNPKLNTSELARHAYGSFATAWRVQKEWELLKEAA